MFGILGLGFLLGMQHALEADHIAAVSSIAARRSHVGDIVRHGLTWGLGHTLTLFAFAGAAILLGRAIPEHVARPIETAVGIMLVGLGAPCAVAAVARPRAFSPPRPWRRHGAHPCPQPCRRNRCRMPARRTRMRHGFRWRTLLVGLMHGMAGSAALLVLAVSQASSPAAGLGYVALFGIGSMIGMGALSTVIAVPLAVSARWLTWANRGLQGAVGVVTIAIGVTTIVETVFGVRPYRARVNSFLIALVSAIERVANAYALGLPAVWPAALTLGFAHSVRLLPEKTGPATMRAGDRTGNFDRNDVRRHLPAAVSIS